MEIMQSFLLQGKTIEMTSEVVTPNQSFGYILRQVWQLFLPLFGVQGTLIWDLGPSIKERSHIHSIKEVIH